MQLSFLGAVGTVTGSKYLLTMDDKKILVDCGLFQGVKEIESRNWDKLPIEAHAIDAVILTHAHLDHSGYLPLLVKNGFTGPIYATPGTKALCALLLPDSGHLQEEDAYFANKHGYSKHKPALPLYTKEDAEKVMRQFVTIPFDHQQKLYNDVNVIFSPAAHILGSSFVRVMHNNSTILFTGDMGRAHDPIMREPSIIETTDYLVIESTYGDRLHQKINPQDELADVINQTARRGGTVVIPAFAVGRAQSILYYIAELKEQNLIPNIPVFLDSPMAESATDIYMRYINEHRLGTEQCKKLGKAATYINTPEESKQLDENRFPMVIISASGMATGGRVLHHLKVFAPDDRNSILFTGYQAKGTLGELILNGVHEVKIHGQIIPIRAQVDVLKNLSAHADYEEILLWLANFKKAPKKVFITHGEPEASLALQQRIKEKLGWTCEIPHYLETVDL